MREVYDIDSEFFNAKQASDWASGVFQKTITPSNISYLVRYGRIKNKAKDGGIKVKKSDLNNYYTNYYSKEKRWKEKLGDDLNWRLSFSEYKEAETTKHVHRLHPYKGKFIPQLVEYFLSNEIDKWKKEIFFHQGDIVLDPFCGSGTTLVEASEQGLYAVGVDVSAFNAMITNSKLADIDFAKLEKDIKVITLLLEEYNNETKIKEFEEELLHKLYRFNNQHFLSAEMIDIIHNKGEGDDYGEEKAKEFLPEFYFLTTKYKIPLLKSKDTNFLKKWYHPHVLQELDIIKKHIDSLEYQKEILSVLLCRTARSARATTHSDLATLLQPIAETYYCAKHGKICKPLFSLQKWWQTYSNDTIKRLKIFDNLRRNRLQHCLVGDSSDINIIASLEKEKPDLANIVKDKKINGIFSSPPYIGLIDYHEQHAYAYDLLNLPRADDSEIGPAFMGQSKIAKEAYVNGIAKVLLNNKKYMINNYNVFLVANDKFDLYPTIAEKAGMKIVEQYKRPVLNRSEKDRTAYAEFIFHMKEK